MGRGTFWFMRRCTTARAVAFQVFLALPFVYELRHVGQRGAGQREAADPLRSA